MIIEIQKVVYPGKSLGTHQGKVVLTDTGLPGETVEVRPIIEKKNYIEARTVRTLLSSPERVVHRCAHYSSCSPYQYIAPAYQLELKKSQVQELFAHNLGMELKELRFSPSPLNWGYRNKVRLRVGWDAGTAFLAYHQPGSQDKLVPVDRCYLISERMNSLLAELRQILTDQRLHPVEEVEVKESLANQESFLNLYLRELPENRAFKAVYSALRQKYSLAGMAGLLKTRTSSKPVLTAGKNSIEEEVSGRLFRVGPLSFFQVNISLLPAVVNDMRRGLQLSGSETLADLYCGVGTFGIIFAPEAREVFGVESFPENISYLKKNLILNRAGNFTVCEGTSEEWAGELLGRKIDGLILDPPRKGVAPAIVQALLARPVSRLIYLSCNPTTLIRDLKRLLTIYKLRNVYAYDFFPHTPHIETLAILELA